MPTYNLSDAEYEIMEYIWKSNTVLTFNDVMEFTHSNGREWKKQTVQTFLTRLIEKGALKAEKKGNRRYYTAASTKEEFISDWTKSFVKEGFGGSLKKFLVAFTGGNSLNDQDAQELHDFLDDEK